MSDNFLNIKKADLRVPLIAFFGVGLPAIFVLYFYISYAANAWFFQDDFEFIKNYADSVQFSQLFDFTNFGRFVSRNVYWHLGVKYFSYHAEYFYILNLLIILCTGFLLYKIFEKHGRFQGIVAGLCYFMLPATIDSYIWLSNSQHLLGHFFVILFVYFFTKDDAAKVRANEQLRAIRLVAILVLGFLSNIFMSMTLSLPIWMMVVDRKHRNSKSNLVVLLVGVLLFAVFLSKLSGSQSGAYATSYTFDTLKQNLDFYYRRDSMAVLWLASVLAGTVVALARKKYFVSWLFLASAAFFLPFAFFVHQRYDQYGALSYLFFLLGVWSLLIDFASNQRSGLTKYAGIVVIIFLFSKSMGPPIRYFSENPRGAAQKQQVEFLKAFDAQNPDVRHYCFRSSVEQKNTTGVKEWDIPPDWWFVGFGKAFWLFVNHDKTYEMVQNAKSCDVLFVFRDGRMEKSGLGRF